jgi:hypothetical protein
LCQDGLIPDGGLANFAIDSLTANRYTLAAPQGARSARSSLKNEKDTRLPGAYGIPTEFGKWVIW